MSEDDQKFPRPPEAFNVGGVIFLGEQDGVPERMLKRELTELFRRTKQVLKAYLAIVRYDEQSPLTVALCLSVSGRPDPKLVEKVGGVFTPMFGSHEHLDIIFLGDAQADELSRVCSPFFVIG